MKYNTTFYIQVYRDGYQIPIMNLESSSIKGFKELSHLGRGHMSKSEGVNQELAEIDKVLNDEKEMHSFGGDDWCIVDFRKFKSTVINGFEEFEPFEIESEVILKILKDWYEFLLKWENNEIPGIIHPKNW